MPTARLASLVAAVTAVLTISAGCAVRLPESSQPGTEAPGGGLGRASSAPSTRELDQLVRGALKDVERYWSATFPRVASGRAFKPVQGGLHAYTRGNPPPACGPEAGQYQPNAFYCPVTDFIAWDAEALIPELHADFGPLLVAVVMAHEYGHAVQHRLDQGQQPTIVLEQQADCFAGSWVADVIAGNSTSFRKIDPDQLDSTLGGMLMLRDQPGTSALSPQAHGNAFDRIRAFQEGVEQGATRCAAYRPDNLPVTEVPFSPEDQATGGNLPYNEALTALTGDAQAYWARVFPRLAGGRAWEELAVRPFDPASPPQCPGRPTNPRDAAGSAFYCAPGDFVAFDGRQLGPTLHRRIGDNAIGMLLADLFAQAAQDRRGQPTQGRQGQLAIDCLAGSWGFDLLHRDADSPLRLSAGDLDEAVATLLVFGRAAQSTDVTAFERIGAFRNGVLKGLSACG
ncbi:MAG TPA: neutral zinc metallopeptidase [Catenuloplanes sp.]|jgi:predicted metalloprotease